MRGLPKHMTTYGAAKAGLAYLAEGIRADMLLTNLPIKVSTIYPGYIRTEINTNAKPLPFEVDAVKGTEAIVAAIESALIRALGGDPTYAGLIAKNPTHVDWRLIDLRSVPYTLYELEDGLDLSGPCKAEQREEAKNQGCAGRNVMVFDLLRFHAYQHVMMYREDSDYMTWKRYLTARADDFNHDQTPPLPFNELKHLVQSVAKWTWTRYTGRLSDEAFSDLQAYRGARGGRISAKVRAEAAEKQGVSLAKQMSELRKLNPSEKKGITKNKPWEAEGISRATWYRRQKN